MYNIYHNTRCKKSRAGLAHLQSKGVDFEVIDYMNNPLSIEEIEQLFVKLNKPVSSMIRTQEKLYKTEFKDKQFTDSEWLRIFIQHPNLMNRPIIANKHKAIWGDTSERIDEFL
jgi:arsenate reductase